MKRKIRLLSLYMIFLNILLCSVSGSVFAEDKISVPAVPERSSKQETEASDNLKESLKNNTFVLETDDQSAAESLERISGKIDMGFSAPENSYKSADHYAPGPFGKEKAEEQKQSDTGY